MLLYIIELTVPVQCSILYTLFSLSTKYNRCHDNRRKMEISQDLSNLKPYICNTVLPTVNDKIQLVHSFLALTLRNLKILFRTIRRIFPLLIPNFTRCLADESHWPPLDGTLVTRRLTSRIRRFQVSAGWTETLYIRCLVSVHITQHQATTEGTKPKIFCLLV